MGSVGMTVIMNTTSIAALPSADGLEQLSGSTRCEATGVDDALRAARHLNLESPQLVFQVGLNPQSVADARSVARRVFTAWNLDLDDAAVDSAIVVISELVTNAVKHAWVLCNVADVTLELVGGVLGISVHDRHPYRPRALQVPHSHGRGGRGLALVRDLVAEAGGRTSVPVDEDRLGKTMRLEIPVSRRDDDAAGESSARRAA